VAFPKYGIGLNDKHNISLNVWARLAAAAATSSCSFR